VNFASLVLRHARERRDRVALVLPVRWDAAGVHEELSVTYGELGAAIARFRGGLRAEGLGPGDRLLLMFPVGLDLYALTLAAMAEGVAIVLVDRSMGGKRILGAIRSSRARHLVAGPTLLRYRFVAPALWGLKRYGVDAHGLGIRPFDRLRGDPVDDAPRDCPPEAHALITFTSGSTGRPKGADRTHGLLTAQHLALAEHFPHAEDEVDLPAFPVVVLHDLCCGVTAVVPPVDFAAVGSVDRDVVLPHARRHGVTRLSGSPAYIDRLCERPLDLPTLRQLGVGGARVSRALAARIAASTDAEALVLYGSTEAEPIASVSVREVAASSPTGALVGPPAAAATVRLIALPDGADVSGGIEPFCVPDGAVGELVVAGEHVNRAYVDDPEATAANKLFPADGTCWHRTGDLALRDAQGRLWLVGRQADVVHVGGRTLHPLLVEEAIETLPGVRRAGLVDVPGLGPTLAVEGDASAVRLPAIRVVAVDRIPVDARHNSRVDRGRLRELLKG
jgi:acyl-CoA synthetase (AMP-forming)/AMP-acid ligase II